MCEKKKGKKRKNDGGSEPKKAAKKQKTRADDLEAMRQAVRLQKPSQDEFPSRFEDKLVKEERYEEIHEEISKWNKYTFYDEIKSKLEKARGDDVDARNFLIDFIASYHMDKKAAASKEKRHDAGRKPIHEIIPELVRWESQVSDGAVSGNGYDELFRTSETMRYLEWSFAPPDGKNATSEIDGETVDWMDAQERVRLKTDIIIWDGKFTKKISGHTGTLHNEYQRAWVTHYQDKAHQLRDDHIKCRSSPANAIYSALAAHLKLTEKFVGEDRYPSDELDNIKLSNGQLVRDYRTELEHQLVRLRTKLKKFAKLVALKRGSDGEKSDAEENESFSDEASGVSDIELHQGVPLLRDVEIFEEAKADFRSLGGPKDFPMRPGEIEFEILRDVDRECPALKQYIKSRYNRVRKAIGNNDKELKKFDDEAQQNMIAAAVHMFDSWKLEVERHGQSRNKNVDAGVLVKLEKVLEEHRSTGETGSDAGNIDPDIIAIAPSYDESLMEGDMDEGAESLAGLDIEIEPDSTDAWEDPSAENEFSTRSDPVVSSESSDKMDVD